MKCDLLFKVENELNEEAKKLVPLCYEENDLLNCKFGEDMEKYMNPLFVEDFFTDVELRTVALCCMKSEGKDWKNYESDKEKCINHKKDIIEYYKFSKDYDDLEKVAMKISDDILNNREKYIGKSLFEIVPKLTHKYMKAHHDSVIYVVLMYLLENVSIGLINETLIK